MRHYIKIISGLILCMLSLSIHATTASLTNIRLLKQDNQTRLIFSLTQAVKPHVFTLQNPNRLVVDFENTRLTEYLKNLNFPTNEIQSVRSGYPVPGRLRLVFEINQPVHYQFTPQDADKHFTLDVSLTKLEKKVQSATLQTSTPPPVVNKPVKIAPQVKKDFIVVIDPGHGGKDPGATGANGVMEKDVVLAIAKRLADLINQQPNMHAVLTRDGDYFVPLRDRLRLARKGKADLFMSIHADSYFNSSSSGASVYALSRRGATSEAARWIAKHENYSELGGVDLADLEDKSFMLRSVLIDLAQTATTTDSLRFGVVMLDSLDQISGLHYSRVEQAPFVVLKSPDIPSILIETGFISNVKDEGLLRDKKHQNKLALAMLNGINTYIKKYSVSG